jgi:hypothetical protein
MVRVALATLPPELSVILPASVALMAWPKVAEAAANVAPLTTIKTAAWKDRIHFLRLTIHPPEFELPQPRNRSKIKNALTQLTLHPGWSDGVVKKKEHRCAAATACTAKPWRLN